MVNTNRSICQRLSIAAIWAEISPHRGLVPRVLTAGELQLINCKRNWCRKDPKCQDYSDVKVTKSGHLSQTDNAVSSVTPDVATRTADG